MKPTLTKSLIATAVLATSWHANAGVEIYNKDGTTFSADGLINIFYVNSSIEATDISGAVSDRDQSRIKMGFLPNNIGFNYGKQLDDLKIEVRSSFWVSINDTDLSRGATALGTNSLIDVRQFYAKLSGDWGSVTLGKDFGLFNRTNILGDELLLGYGQTSDTFGLVDGGNVSFGNISTGYSYPMPKAQITYRTNDMNGFNVAVGVMDPSKSAADSSEDTPRIEFEASYTTELNNVGVKGWLNGLSQTSEVQGIEQDQSGLGYGLNVKFSGLSLTASGYSSEGVGYVAGLDNIVGAESNESDGSLLQASYTTGDNRFVISSGETENQDTANMAAGITTHKNFALGYFRTVRPGIIMVAEFNNTESENSITSLAEDNKTFSIGTVVTF
ncbi:MAG: putative porin [Bermanella sp.]|jgi:predicted porin|uniref:porin n=1 Tax=Glaciecola sp. 33A TaxID=2057807 RepID=UPI000C321F3D|nr:porin [Glaciecola sp. 33A]PKI01256.1 porin [Glaciecola sp. 33A]